MYVIEFIQRYHLKTDPHEKLFKASFFIGTLFKFNFMFEYFMKNLLLM